MLMRCMMAVMLLLGFASLNTAIHGQSLTGSEPDKGPDLTSGQARSIEPASVPKANGTVSVAALKIPEKAMKEVQRSDKAFLSGDVQGSAEHLEKALEIYPNMAVVHNALGARYAELKEHEKAIAEFEKAIALNPRYHLAMDNMTVEMCVLHRFADAEPIAKQALALEPESANSEYLLGSILVEEGHYTGEPVRLLENAKVAFPRAHLFLAKAAVGRGETGKAAEELRAYLQSPAAEKKAAQDWLEMLQRQDEAARKTAKERQAD
jgi:tetratricopeptide (TPR) repeat protein